MATDKESATKVDLGLLEEDDEFEEFPADGVCHNRKIPLQICSYFFLETLFLIPANTPTKRVPFL